MLDFPINNVIILGATGFVGTYTCEYFVSQGVAVTAVGRRAIPERLEKLEGLTYIQCDLDDIATLPELLEVRDSEGYDALINLASRAISGEARKDLRTQFQNVYDTEAILKVCKQIGCGRILCFGSIAERDMEQALHLQGVGSFMTNNYALSKLATHYTSKALAGDLGIDHLWLVLANIYGPQDPNQNFINMVLTKCKNHEPLQFTSGVQNYDFVYATDVARAIYDIARHGRPFYEYFVASGGAKPLKEFIAQIIEAVAPDASYELGSAPFMGVNLPLSAYDTSLTEADTGFRAEMDFIEGIRWTFARM
ncbi:MAG: NAD-dependent epimerase/dehydratase family protein [Clostridiales Family XIII bacterium]|jgi:nucleoside-diphosphate-sugar epimerase|nr:NAD-dependent epimerase/dehydratase family protein [Clostridiales Family XIII bacterium]